MVDEIDTVDGTDAVDGHEVTRRLVHVRYAAAAVGEAEHGLHEAVARARHVGASWLQLAEALGISEPAAQQRFEGDGRSADASGP